MAGCWLNKHISMAWCCVESKVYLLSGNFLFCLTFHLQFCRTYNPQVFPTFTWQCRSCLILQPKTKAVLRRWQLFILGLYAVQKKQLDSGYGAEVPRVAAHCQRSQAWRQFCREENSLWRCSILPKHFCTAGSAISINKHGSDGQHSCKQWAEKQVILLYLQTQNCSAA